MLVPEDSSGLDTLGVLRKYSHHVAGLLISNANTSAFIRITLIFTLTPKIYRRT